MLSKIIMPPGGQTTNESTITLWHKKVGDAVERGDVLFEIETDKATLEVESYAKGILKAIYFKEFEKAFTGQIVAYVGDADDVLPGAQGEGDKDDDDYAPIMSDHKKDTDKAGTTITADSPLSASPKARKTAADSGVDIHALYNHIGKAVKNSDVLSAVGGEKKAPASAADEGYYFVDTSSMRRSIALKMADSLKSTAQYTVSMDINMSKATAFRKNINEHIGDNDAKISINDMLIKSAARAIMKYPLINAVYGEKQIKVYSHVNCGLAVSVDGGLVVPVIKNADEKTLSEIAADSSFAVKTVKGGKLDMKLMSGGTITVSNLGMLGVKHFTAILNYPESCILAVGMIEDRLILEGGEVKAIPSMNITASFDHRLIDGAYGAGFLKELKTILENPELLAY